MCSFLFLMLAQGKQTDLDTIKKANTLMQRRGPDHTQVFVHGRMAFLHNLLHLSGERPVIQPVVSTLDDGNIIVLMFNGEIFNYRSFGDWASDTECLIPLYLEKGRDFVKDLDGEFAIVLYDGRDNTLLVSTDVFMTKPCYIGRTDDNGDLCVASYASGITHLLGARARVDMAQPNLTVVYDLTTNTQVHSAPVFVFDLRQYKRWTSDWERAFEEAIRKRAEHGGKFFVCMSSGYDSATITLALNRLQIPYDTYSTTHNENADVIVQRQLINRLKGNNGNVFTCHHLPENEISISRDQLREEAEPFRYVHEDSPGVHTMLCDDGGARALNIICRHMRPFGYKVVLSGSGADEIMSDYGFMGKKIYYHSEFGGHFPEDLTRIFPWKKFYDDTQRSYLFKDEFVAGANGMEGRYPFLDKQVVQEFLWLANDLKNDTYKGILAQYLEKHGYPYEKNKKTGFSI